MIILNKSEKYERQRPNAKKPSLGWLKVGGKVESDR